MKPVPERVIRSAMGPAEALTAVGAQDAAVVAETWEQVGQGPESPGVSGCAPVRGQPGTAAVLVSRSG